ncbi:phasin [Bradyrhizobium sp.]|uniref:phasin n=1 Tax=Bradyrhizobium sp. TaxID=376 RepID=UPI002D6C7543|nr:phasin [Bradyrhizobium sp.]HZR77030.1 phasin [Bradyrhizobium sp.]
MEGNVNANVNTKSKTSKTSGAFEGAKAEARSEMPKFDFLKMEIPTAFREIAEKGLSQAKENYEKLKVAAEEATDVLEETYASATRGGTDYGLKLIDAARANTNAAFDFFSEFITVKSLAEAVELSTAHARKQFDQVSEQGRELASIAQKVLNEASEPIKSGVSKAFSKVA